MTGVNPTVSNRLKAAEDRLTRAIDRLETVLEKRTDAAGVSPVDAELLAQAQGLQAENASLRELVDDTAARLDGTIAKFKSKLAGQG